MKKTLLTTLLLSAIIFSAGAEKIIFSNAPTGYKEADISGTATIDTTDGDITVDTSDRWIVGEQPGSVAFYPSATHVVNNGTTNFNWVVNFVENCRATNSSGGPTSDWSISVTNPSTHGTHTQHNVLVGDIGSGKTFYLTCDKLIGTGSITKSFTINKIDNSGGGVTTPTITAFSVTPTSLPAGGGDVTLSWTSSNSTRCIASASPFNAEWSGPVGTSGTKNNVSITQSTRFTLTCYNGPGAAAPHVTNNNPYTNVPNTNPTSCTGVQAPPDGKILKDLGTLATVTNTTNGNNALNNPSSTTVIFELTKGQYAALEFIAPTSGRTEGTIAFDSPPTNLITPLGYRITISQCAGDFSTDSMPQYIGCGKQHPRASMNWSVDANAPATQCKLIPGQKYYLNIINSTDAPDYNVSSCSSPKCGVLFGVY